MSAHMKWVRDGNSWVRQTPEREVQLRTGQPPRPERGLGDAVGATDARHQSVLRPGNISLHAHHDCCSELAPAALRAAESIATARLSKSSGIMWL